MDPTHLNGRILLVVAALALAAAIALVMMPPGGSQESVGSAAHAAPGQVSASTASSDPRGARSESGADAPRDKRSEAGGPTRGKQARERLMRHIRTARAQRLRRARHPASRGGATEAPALTPEEEAGELDKEYIRERFAEIIPLVTECYEMALERQPDLRGQLVVEFAISGEPEIGGLVESSEIDAEASTFHEPGMAECISETVYALEFKPPAEGGSVVVRYPLKFYVVPD